MANNTIMIQMDKARNLKYTFNTLVELEEDFGKPIAEVGANMTMKDARTLIYHGLKWEDKNLTPDKTGELISNYIENGNSFQELFEEAGKAFTKAMGNSAVPTR